MAFVPSSQRTALLAGATGLVGRALLPLLLRSHASVEVLVRRAVPGLDADPKIRLRVVDFANLHEPLQAIDDVFIALGTTIKVAGSESVFRAVDFDLVVAIARAARDAGARRLAVVSALGANPRSGIFYNRVKGEMEEAVAELGYETLVIAQPSLLIGERGEVLATRVLGPLMSLVPARVRPI